jgi:putative transcriptional regulator
LSEIKNSNVISPTDELITVAGSVVLSESPAHQLKYWRKQYGIKQADLARKMKITPSVLSDYEKGRRPSPGVNFIKRYLLALHELTKQAGSSHDGESEVAAAPVADAHIN